MTVAPENADMGGAVRTIGSRVCASLTALLTSYLNFPLLLILWQALVRETDESRGSVFVFAGVFAVVLLPVNVVGATSTVLVLQRARSGRVLAITFGAIVTSFSLLASMLMFSGLFLLLYATGLGVIGGFQVMSAIRLDLDGARVTSLPTWQ